MKKNLLTIVLAIFGLYIQAQTDTKQIASKLSTSNYVFEGIVESVEFFAGDKQANKLPASSVKWEGGGGYFHNPDGSEAKGYSLAKIKLYKVYKGAELTNSQYAYILSSTDGLQVFLTSNGKDTVLNHMNFATSHDDNFLITPSMKNYRVILFANKNPQGNYVVLNKSSVVYFNSTYSENATNDVDKVLGGIEGANFNSYSELNQFLGSISGVNVNAKEKFEISEKKSANVSNEIEVNKNKIDYQQNLNNYNQRLKEFAIRQANNINKSLQKSTLVTDLNLQIANPRLSGPDNAPRLDFDILVSSNVGTTYYDGALLRIIYNTSAFGSSVVTNGNLTITRAPAFNIATYTNPQADAIDQTSNVIGVPFGSDFSQSSFSRVLITTTPKKMLTFSIKIQTCGQTAGVNFTDISFTPLFSFYTNNAGDPISSSVSYDNTNYSGSVTDVMCTPIITSWNNNVPAGENGILTITGKYFGPAKGSGTVIFKNADKGTVYPAPTGPYKGGVQQFDVLKWNNDTIKINIPGIIDSTISGGSVPGTGKFQVLNRYSYSKESSSPVIIPHAILSYPDWDALNLIYAKGRPKLSGNVGNGYRVQINPSVMATIPNSKPIIRKAMKDWSCATGINWYLGADTAVSALTAPTALCIVDTGGISPLMITNRVIRFCPLPGNKKDYYMKSFTIRIKPVPSGGPWIADSTNAISAGTYDFYSAISHEFGHGHGVSHINDSIVDLMWWAGYNVGYPFNLRKLVKGSPMARTAAEYMTDSLTGVLNCISSHFTITVSNCEDFIGIKKNFNDLFNIAVAPNPSSANESLKIKFNLTQQENVKITLFDITGHLIQQEELKNVKEEEYPLHSDNIEAGIYLLQISINDRKQSYKIIKQ